jgi:predicted metal-dependent HD superfamily phosphohydrolase
VPQDAVTLDQSRWLGLWARLGAGENGAAIFQSLTTAYAEPTRSYHTADHIRDCLIQLDRNRKLPRRPDEVEVALWFHDAVYIPGAPNNEESSAGLAQTALAQGGVPLEITRRVANLILATQHLSIPSDTDAQVLCDIDLSILGREASEFDEFERRIRREYSWVPDPTYRSARSAVLAGFLRRSSIYQTKEFVYRYESRARKNLTRALAALAG